MPQVISLVRMIVTVANTFKGHLENILLECEADISLNHSKKQAFSSRGITGRTPSMKAVSAPSALHQSPLKGIPKEFMA